jgi:predicted metal-dependent hydrolase
MRIEVTRKRIKNMYLRVGEDGTVKVSAPLMASDREIRAFVESRADWIEKAINRAKNRAENLPEYLDDPRLKKAAQKELRKRLEERVPLMEQRTGLRCSGWNIRDVRSYWGKCDTRTNRITFNLRLVNRTDEELDYVIVHELCHTVYGDHSGNFWSLVKRFMPDYERIRKGMK